MQLELRGVFVVGYREELVFDGVAVVSPVGEDGEVEVVDDGDEPMRPSLEDPAAISCEKRKLRSTLPLYRRSGRFNRVHVRGLICNRRSIVSVMAERDFGAPLLVSRRAFPIFI